MTCFQSALTAYLTHKKLIMADIPIGYSCLLPRDRTFEQQFSFEEKIISDFTMDLQQNENSVEKLILSEVQFEKSLHGNTSV